MFPSFLCNTKSTDISEDFKGVVLFYNTLNLFINQEVCVRKMVTKFSSSPNDPISLEKKCYLLCSKACDSIRLLIIFAFCLHMGQKAASMTRVSKKKNAVNFGVFTDVHEAFYSHKNPVSV